MGQNGWRKPKRGGDMVSENEHGMGWIPDYPDFRDHTEETAEKKIDSRSYGCTKSEESLGVCRPQTVVLAD